MTREELVKKMLDAFDKERMGLFGDFNGAARRQCFAAALDVAVGELLACCYSQEADDAFKQWNAGHGATRIMDDFLASRRSRYLPKSAEDRVTIEPAGGGEHSIWLDGKRFSNVQFYYYADAECFRLGLIQQLRKADAK